MEFSERLEGLSSNIFLQLEQEKQRILAKGGRVFNLSVGTPDLPPDRHVMETLSREALNPENYKYAIVDKPELTTAVINWYKRRYNVELEPDELMSVYGSQEGMAHIGLSICDPRDICLVPDPGYPIFSFGPFLSGAKLVKMPLLEKNGYLIDFDAIPSAVADKAKLMVVSYPNNPVTARATDEFYERLVAFAKRHDIIVLHDNAYSELVLTGEPAQSFLSFPGAKDVGVEFNSLSKSYNLTGARISFALGNKKVLENFRKLRSQIDYGIFPAVQLAAVAALNGPQDIVARNREIYRSRQDVLCQGLRRVGWAVPDCDSTMFTWFPLPGGATDSTAFSVELLQKTGVMCVPGITFGTLGEGYVRMALVQPEDVLKQACEAIGSSGMLG
ncbi:aminotransferase class I/II-fold pyridoxal phosphate-dependent enzyme [Oscillospiraceae bacterium MB08-C2-2]|nr:aminotransferase class I/II-fold pyridoxal phosphate-dependent enzyme [Oscillospiraceae bacterium MB08-C2-2]